MKNSNPTYPSISFLALVVILLLSSSCDDKPKVIASSNESANTENATGIFSESKPQTEYVLDVSAFRDGMHTVVIKEALPTSKYIYLLVEENEEEFWIATLKKKINIGGKYIYNGGLLKTNFESKEHNRVFDRLYLVSNLVEANHGDNATSKPLTTAGSKAKASSKTNPINVKGSVKIGDLAANPSQYANKKIQISGQCVKVNDNIMGRNWIHLDDGSNDGFDLVITSKDVVKVGQKVTMRATVILNKDFGAGYKFDVILEDGVLVN